MAKLEAKQKRVEKNATDHKERAEPALQLLNTQPTVLKDDRQIGIIIKVDSAIVSMGLKKSHILKQTEDKQKNKACLS